MDELLDEVVLLRGEEQFWYCSTRRENQKLDVRAWEAAQVVEVKELENELYLVHKIDVAGEQGEGGEEFKSVDQKVVICIKALEELLSVDIQSLKQFSELFDIDGVGLRDGLKEPEVLHQLRQRNIF
jgi:hypothetical protein